RSRLVAPSGRLKGGLGQRVGFRSIGRKPATAIVPDNSEHHEAPTPTRRNKILGSPVVLAFFARQGRSEHDVAIDEIARAGCGEISFTEWGVDEKKMGGKGNAGAVGAGEYLARARRIVGAPDGSEASQGGRLVGFDQLGIGQAGRLQKIF